MKAILAIDGFLVGTLEYELPKDSRGKRIKLPSAESRSQAVVIVSDGDSTKWVATGTLERA